MARNDEAKTGIEAIYHARKYLSLGQESGFGLKAGGLLAHPSDTEVEPFRVWNRSSDSRTRLRD
jgi:macrophage erythroblast attacher